MLSDAFQQLLDIQLERYDAMLRDCRPHVDSHYEGDAFLHERLVRDVEALVDLTRDFKQAAKVAASAGFEQRKAVVKAFERAGVISTNLWNDLYVNMELASPFRRPALTRHAQLMGTISMEHVTTNLTVYWHLMDEVIARSKAVLEEPAAPDEGAGKKDAKRPVLRLVK